MNVSQILITSVLAAVLVVGFGLLLGRGLQAHPFGGASTGDGVFYKHHRHGMHHGGWGGGRRARLAHFCGDGPGEHVDRAIEHVADRLDITPEQREPWDAVVAALRGGSTAFAGACARLEDRGFPSTAPDKLAFAETVLSEGLDVLRAIRPRLDALYVALSEAQRQALDDLLSRRRH